MRGPLLSWAMWIAASTLLPLAAQDTRPETEPSQSRPTRRGRTLALVEGPDEVRAAGAVVEFVVVTIADFESNRRDFDWLTGVDPSGRHPVARLVADEAGLVKLPAFTEGAFVRATRGDACGQEWLDAVSPRPLRVKLESSIRVRVVDDAGVPKPGVMVVLGPFHEGRLGWGRSCVPTGADGIARFARLRPPRNPLPGLGQQDWKVMAAVPVPTATIVRVPVEIGEPPPEPLEIRLPQTGRLKVVLKRPDGTPFEAGAAVRIAQETGDPVSDIDLGREPAPWAEAAAHAGVAVFPTVGVGTKLLVHVEPGEDGLRSVMTSIDGPTSTGAESSVEVVCGASNLSISGRYLLKSGAPGVRLGIEASLPREVKTDRERFLIGPHKAVAQTDEKGRFVLRFDVDPGAFGASVLELLVPSGRTRSKVERSLPQVIEGGRVELGDVQAIPPRLIAEGALVDDRGEPVNGAWISAEHPSPAESRNTEDLLRESEDKSELIGLGARTNAKGRFVIRGQFKAEDLELVVVKEGYFLSKPFLFEVGEKDLVVTVGRAGGLSGTFAPFGLTTGRQIEVAVVGEPARTNLSFRRSNPDRLTATVAGDGFSADSLKPGTCAVEVRIWSKTEPLVIVRDVVIKPGETTRDPRLIDLDLSKLLARHVVSIKTEAGNSVVEALVNVRDGEGRTSWSGDLLSNDAGQVVLATVKRSTDVMVRMPGRRTELFAGVSGELTVTLRKQDPISVAVELDKAPAVTDPWILTAELKWKCSRAGDEDCDERDLSQPRNRRQEALAFGADRRLALKVQDRGLYKLEIAVKKATSGWSPSETLVELPVTLEEAPVTLRPSIDPERLAKAIERLQQER